MPEFEPQNPNQRGYDAQARRVTVDLGQSVTLLLRDGMNASVSVDDPAVATITQVGSGDPAPFTVVGRTRFRETFVRAVKPGSGGTKISIRVAPNARFVSPDDDGLIDAVEIDRHSSVSVNLSDGAGLLVAVRDNDVAAVHEIASSGNDRQLRISSLAVGKTVVEASAPDGGWQPLATLQVGISLGPAGTRYHCAPPNYDGEHCHIPPELGDVPDDLMQAADGSKVAFPEEQAKPWTLPQAQFAFKLFLHAAHELAARDMPRRSAVLLVAQSLHENSLNTLGPNIDPRFKNYFAYQPGRMEARTVNGKPDFYLPADDPEVLALRKVNVAVTMEPRGNDQHGSSTPTPHYADIAQCIQCQLDVALPMRFKGLLQVLKDPRSSGDGFAAAAAAGGYGDAYRENYPGEYRTALAFVKRALKKVNVSYEANTWCSRMLLQL